jgi:tetratricopeptide (TPR) repeat protein
MRKLRGDKDLNTLLAANILAQIYMAQGNLDKAEPLAKWVYETGRSVLGDKARDVIPWRINLAMIYVIRENYAKAEPLLAGAVEDQRATLPKEHPQRATTLALLGLARLREKKWEAAEAPLRECLEMRAKNPDAWQTFNSKSMLGGALLGQKKYADAEPLLLDGYEGMKKREKTIQPVGLPRLKEAGARIVELYEAWDKPDKAKEWREKLKE